MNDESVTLKLIKDIKFQKSFCSALRVKIQEKYRFLALNKKVLRVNVKRRMFESDYEQITYQNLERNPFVLEPNQKHIFTFSANNETRHFLLKTEKTLMNNSQNLRKFSLNENQLRDLLSSAARIQGWSKLQRKIEHFIQKLCKFCHFCLKSYYDSYDSETYDPVIFPKFHDFCLFDSTNISIDYYKIQFEEIKLKDLFSLGAQANYHEITQNEFFRFRDNNEIFSYYSDFRYNISWMKKPQLKSKLPFFLLEEQEKKEEQTYYQQSENFSEIFDVDDFLLFIKEETLSGNLSNEAITKLLDTDEIFSYYSDFRFKNNEMKTIPLQKYEKQTKLSLDNLTTVEKSALLDFIESMKGFLKQEQEKVEEQKDPENEQQSDNLLELLHSDSADFSKNQSSWENLFNAAKVSGKLSKSIEFLNGFFKPEENSEDSLPSYLEEKSEEKKNISDNDAEIIKWLLKIAKDCERNSNFANYLAEEPLKPAFCHLWKALPFSKEMKNSDVHEIGLNSIF